MRSRLNKSHWGYLHFRSRLPVITFALPQHLAVASHRCALGLIQTKSSSPSNSLLQGRSSQLSPHFAAARSAVAPQRVKEAKIKPSTCPKPQLAPTSSLCSRLRRKNSPSDFQKKGSKPQLAAPSPVCTRCSRAAAPLPLN